MGVWGDVGIKVADTAENDRVEDGRFSICGITVTWHDCLLRPLFS